MRFLHLTVAALLTDATASGLVPPLNGSPGGAIDVGNLVDAAFTTYLTGTSGASITLALQGSNAVVPPTQTAPDSSFFQIYDDSTAIAQTVTADGVYTLAASEKGIPCRWLRLKVTVNTPGGGTYSTDFFGRGYA